MTSSKILLSSIVAISLLTGCGSSGSDSSDTSLEFPSNAVEANATAETAQEVGTSVEGGSIMDPSMMMMVSDTNNTKTIGANNAIIKMINNIHFDKLTKNSNALNETYNDSETFECDNGGTETFTTNFKIDETTGKMSGTSSITMNNCDGQNGSLTLEMAATYNVDSDILESISKFNMTVGSNGYSFETGSLAANSSISLSNIVTNEDEELKSYTMTLNYQATEGTKKYGAKDFIINYDSDSSFLYTDYSSGRVYINNLLSYVTVDPSYDCSTTPFKESNSWYSSSYYYSGECRFIGANNSKIKLLVSGGELMYALDPEGDGTYETAQSFEE